MKKLWPIILGVVGFIATIAITAIFIFKVFLDTQSVNGDEFKDSTDLKENKYTINMYLNDDYAKADLSDLGILVNSKTDESRNNYCTYKENEISK